MKFILRTSYDMNTEERDRYTIFQWACIRGEIETVKLLIESSKDFGIDLNVKNRFGWTAFALCLQLWQNRNSQNDDSIL